LSTEKDKLTNKLQMAIKILESNGLLNQLQTQINNLNMEQAASSSSSSSANKATKIKQQQQQQSQQTSELTPIAASTANTNALPVNITSAGQRKLSNSDMASVLLSCKCFVIFIWSFFFVSVYINKAMLTKNLIKQQQKSNDIH
jgi:hypothetical protein